MLKYIVAVSFLLTLLIFSEVSAADNATDNGHNKTVEILVKLHGAGMIAAWGIVIPLGMSIALMCKSVCPGKAYVYTHMSFMIVGLAIVLVSLTFILIHAEGKWLNTFDPLSDPHKILGIIAIAVLILNPFLAIVTPKEDSKWRSLYNIAHGGVGFFVGLLSALTAMLIATHFLPSLSNDADRTKLILILVSALVGYIILLLAVYNVYPIRYHKSIPQPFKVPDMIKEYRRLAGDIQLADDEKITIESSPDSTYRVVAMTITLTPLIVLGIACITYLMILE